MRRDSEIFDFFYVLTMLTLFVGLFISPDMPTRERALTAGIFLACGLAGSVLLQAVGIAVMAVAQRVADRRRKAEAGRAKEAPDA